jgi:hypothetical protein
VTNGQGDDAGDGTLAWDEVAERLERLRRQGERFTSQRKLAKQIGCSSATVNKAIRNTPSLRAWAKIYTTPKAQSITPVVTDSTAQNRELEPEDQAAINEYRQREDLTPDERAFFNGLTPQDQIEFLEGLEDQPKILGRTP